MPDFRTKPELAEAAGIETYDTALPQGWLDRVRAVTGEYPLADFVWSYDPPNRVIGRPAAITEAGTALLARLPESLYGPVPDDQFREGLQAPATA